MKLYIFPPPLPDPMRPRQHGGGSRPLGFGRPRPIPEALRTAQGPTEAAVARCGSGVPPNQAPADNPRPHGDDGGPLQFGRPLTQARWTVPASIKSSQSKSVLR